MRTHRVDGCDQPTEVGGLPLARSSGAIDTEAEQAAQLAAGLCRNVQELGIKHDYSDAAPEITLSIGVATCKPVADQSPETLVGWADEALYEAKESGRNRYRVYSALSS